jgi:diacylglycerol O-acyltransferase / wax synthase
VLAETRPWRPSPEPSGAELVLDAWSGLAADARGWAEKVEHGVAHPREGLQAAAQVGLGLLTFAQRLVSTRALFSAGHVGAHRRYAFASVQLDDLRFIRKNLGGTLNDVVLAAISGAYRTLLARHQVAVDHAGLRSLVPVSVRGVDEKGVAGNRVSAILCDLPVHLADPVARLSAVREQMMRLKASHMAEAGERVTDLGNLAPPMIVGPITRLIARMMHELPQKAVQTVTTNVPGPPVPLYCLGRRLRENYPYVPITQGMRSGIAVLSYSGQISFGITGDYDTAQDVELLAQAIVDEISTLRSLAQEAQTMQSRSTV